MTRPSPREHGVETGPIASAMERALRGCSSLCPTRDPNKRRMLDRSSGSPQDLDTALAARLLLRLAMPARTGLQQPMSPKFLTARARALPMPFCLSVNLPEFPPGWTSGLCLLFMAEPCGRRSVFAWACLRHYRTVANPPVEDRRRGRREIGG